jgi:curved DNA-binding protein CbpA
MWRARFDSIRLSKEFHPDLNKDDAASVRKFKEIAEAYEILGNPDQRKTYDEQHGFNR